MRKLSALIVFCLPLALACGCSCPEMKAMSTAWQVIGPEYKAYVAADATKADDQKRNRFATVDILDKAIAAYEGK